MYFSRCLLSNDCARKEQTLVILISCPYHTNHTKYLGSKWFSHPSLRQVLGSWVSRDRYKLAAKRWASLVVNDNIIKTCGTSIPTVDRERNIELVAKKNTARCILAGALFQMTVPERNNILISCPYHTIQTQYLGSKWFIHPSLRQVLGYWVSRDRYKLVAKRWASLSVNICQNMWD